MKKNINQGAIDKTLVSAVRTQHENANSAINQRNTSYEQLLKDYIIEKNAKNQACYFILENGHLEQFRVYCQQQSKQSVSKT